MKFLTNYLTILSLVWSSAMILNVVAIVHPADAAVPESVPATLVVIEADERASPTASWLHDSFRQLVAPFFAPKEEDAEVLVYNNSEDTTDDDEESVVVPRRGLAHLRGSAKSNNNAAGRTLSDYGGNAYGYRAVGGRTHYRNYNNGGGYGRSYGYGDYGDNDNYEYGRGGGYSARYGGDNDRYEYGGKRYGYNSGGYSRYGGGGGGYGRYGDNDGY